MDKPNPDSTEKVESDSTQEVGSQATEKVVPEVAQKEIDRWLDAKKVKPKKRETYSEQIDILVEGVVDGTLALSDDCKFTHTFAFALTNAKGDITLKSITYKPRLTVKQINAKMVGVKPSDADARVMGYIAALTDQPSAVLSNMDTEDYSIAQSIATFFYFLRIPDYVLMPIDESVMVFTIQK